MEEKKGGGWKWIAGGLALILSYQMGYEAGSERRVSEPSPVAQPGYLSTISDEALMGSDAVPAASPVMTDLADASAEISGGTNAPDEAVEPAPDSPLDAPPRPAAPEPLSSDRTQSLLAALEPDSDEETIESASDSLALAPSATSSLSKPAASSGYDAPKPAYGCAENGSCYGDFSTATGRPKTVAVRGYYRRDGTYVRGHYRSRPR